MSSQAATPRVEIAQVIQHAEQLAATVGRELPTHQGLQRAAAQVEEATRTAARVAQELRRPLSLHRLPALFLALALLSLAGWIYWEFVHVSTLTIALPDRDATLVRDRVAQDAEVKFLPVLVPGSREAVEQVAQGTVDLAFVQGGIAIPFPLPRLETKSPELVLWFVRTGREDPRALRTILTSSEGEGSHSVAQSFTRAWGVEAQVSYRFDWKALTAEAPYDIPGEVDAVLVVKDPGDEATLRAASRLAEAGFALRSPWLGARANQFDYLRQTTLPAGFLRIAPPYPTEAVETYAVSTFLVAREGLTPRTLAVAGHLLDRKPLTIDESGAELGLSEAGAIFQGVDAFLGVILNIVLAFLALLGLEMMTYRRRFHELNSLISLLSMLQSSKDVLGLTSNTKKKERLLYLSLCSDLLGLISATSGYYTQENSALLFNNLSEIIHQRCDNLKLNIQIKILHAMIELPSEPAEAAPIPYAQSAG